MTPPTIYGNNNTYNMKHFKEDNYDPMADYEFHIGCQYEKDEYDEHSLLYHTEDNYEDDFNEGCINHFQD